MILEAPFCCDVPPETLSKYFEMLIGKVFKILPLSEDDRQSAKTYLDGLHRELSGLKTLFWVINKEPAFISLLSIINWLKYHILDDNCTKAIIKKEVFDAISICEQLQTIIPEKVVPSGGDNDE